MHITIFRPENIGISVPVVLFSNRRVLSILSKYVDESDYSLDILENYIKTNVEAFYDIYDYSYLDSCLCYINLYIHHKQYYVVQ